jgi:tetratricopeptide (TPR) repeat protein
VKKALLTTLLLFLVGAVFLPAGYGQEWAAAYKAGVSEYRAGNYNKAVSIMDKIIQIAPDNYYARYYLAISFVKLKQYKEARKQYQQIINESGDEKLVSYAHNGLTLLNPLEQKSASASKVSVIEVQEQENNDNIANNENVANIKTSEDYENYEKQISAATEQQTDNQQLNPNNKQYQNNLYAQTMSPQQQAMIADIAARNKVDPGELNNLIQLLAKNPSALQTLNKLAGNQQSGTTPDKMDPEHLAKMMKIMALNSQMSLLGSLTDSDDKKKNNSMDMMGMLMGQQMNSGMFGMMNNMGQGGAGAMNPMMNLMNGNTGNNTDMMNMLLQQNMMNMGGF